MLPLIVGKLCDGLRCKGDTRFPVRNSVSHLCSRANQQLCFLYSLNQLPCFYVSPVCPRLHTSSLNFLSLPSVPLPLSSRKYKAWVVFTGRFDPGLHVSCWCCILASSNLLDSRTFHMPSSPKPFSLLECWLASEQIFMPCSVMTLVSRLGLHIHTNKWRNRSLKNVNRNSDKIPLKSMEKSHAKCVALATWQPLALIQLFIDLYPTFIVWVYLKSYSTGWSEWHIDWRTHSDLIKWSIRQFCVLPNSSVIVGLCLVLCWRIVVWISVAGNW